MWGSFSIDGGSLFSPLVGGFSQGFSPFAQPLSTSRKAVAELGLANLLIPCVLPFQAMMEHPNSYGKEAVAGCRLDDRAIETATQIVLKVTAFSW